MGAGESASQAQIQTQEKGETMKPNGKHGPDSDRVKLLRKLYEIMDAIPSLVKTGSMGDEGSEQYAYHEADSIRVAFREQLLRQRVLCLPVESIPDRWSNATSTGGTFNYCMQRIRYAFMDVDTGEEIRVEAVGVGGDSLDKTAPKAAIQALKYLLVNGFFVEGIELDGDSFDEQEAGKEANKPHIWLPEGVPDIGLQSNGKDLDHPWIMIDGVRAWAISKKHKTAGTLRNLYKMGPSEKFPDRKLPRVRVRAFMGSLNGDKNAQPVIDKIEILETDIKDNAEISR